jgi:hypothetical protein
VVSFSLDIRTRCIAPHHFISPLPVNLAANPYFRTYKDVEISDISLEDYIAVQVTSWLLWRYALVKLASDSNLDTLA